LARCSFTVGVVTSCWKVASLNSRSLGCWVPEPDDSTPAKVRNAATLTGPAQRRGLRLRNRDPVRAGVQRLGPELLHPGIQALGQVGHLALGQALDAERLGQLLHPPG